MPKASRKELRKQLFKRGAESRGEAKEEAKAKHDAIEAAKPAPPPLNKRFILFVGNLPYDITEDEIKKHFKNCEPSSIRLRSNGICFLEFKGDDGAAQLHHALQYHHSLLRNRKINVEFSAGGGGNSAKRREKIRQKNLNFQEEIKGKKDTKLSAGGNRLYKPSAEDRKAAAESGINPARLAALKAKS